MVAMPRRRVRGHRGVVLAGVLLMLAAACGDGGDESGDASSDAAGGVGGGGEAVTLSIASNAARGGKNDTEAVWIEDYVIPTFQERMAADGTEVTVQFEGRGADDEAYKSQLALDLRSGGGDDILTIDGIWLGEFVQAGYLQPLTEVVGPETDDWDGWEQIPDAVQQNTTFEDARYGIPTGTDGRIIYFNKDLFEQAGLPADWQPGSWDEILEAARTLKQQLPDVVPLQLNAGTAAGEATTMQGVLPLLAGAGQLVYDDQAQQWLGNTPALQGVLEMYATVYGDEQLGDPQLQLRQDGRDRSFQDFAEGRIAMLIESDYLWRDVINPDGGIAPMEQRDEIVGWTHIPAQQAGAGIEGHDVVSMSGGAGRVLNPNTEHPQEAWQLLTFMHSREAVLELVGGQPRVTERDDVNSEVLSDDPLLSFIAEEVLPVTAYRPPLALYPQVSVALQEATEQVVNGTSVQEAAQGYQSEMERIVGADSVATDG